MARSIAKRKYKKIRKEFKSEIKEALINNRALGMAILNTYVADKHRTHIHKIWHLLGTQHKEAWKGYCKSGLRGKMLCGDENLYDTLYFSGYEKIANKYRRRLPAKIAFGEIYGLVIKAVNNKLVEIEKRNCTNCNREMTEGYVICDGTKYYCSDACLHEEFTEKEYRELYEQGQAYWTQF